MCYAIAMRVPPDPAKYDANVMYTPVYIIVNLTFLVLSFCQTSRLLYTTTDLIQQIMMVTQSIIIFKQHM